jgi:hypothetical protein
VSNEDNEGVAEETSIITRRHKRPDGLRLRMIEDPRARKVQWQCGDITKNAHRMHSISNADELLSNNFSTIYAPLYTADNTSRARARWGLGYDGRMINGGSSSGGYRGMIERSSQVQCSAV